MTFSEIENGKKIFLFHNTEFSRSLRKVNGPWVIRFAAHFKSDETIDRVHEFVQSAEIGEFLVAEQYLIVRLRDQ